MLSSIFEKSCAYIVIFCYVSETKLSFRCSKAFGSRIREETKVHFYVVEEHLDCLLITSSSLIF